MGDYSQEYAFVDNWVRGKTFHLACPRNIQMTRDPEKLRTFLEEQQNPGEDLKAYLEARIEALEYYDKLRENRVHNKGPAPKLIEKDGKSFLDLNMPENQTSDKGSWSVSLNMLLRSRGVDIPQEVIRAYRSPYEKDDYENWSYTRDRGAELKDRLDLISDALPNTMVRTRDYGLVTKKGSNQLDATDEHIQGLANALYQDIETAITEKKSPVYLYMNGHARTVIGVDPNEKALLFKDPMGNPPDQTFYCSAKDLAESGVNSWDGKDYGNGIFKLGWLEDVDPKKGIEYAEGKINYKDDKQRGRKSVSWNCFA